jgi:prevent-host-death family protein
MAMKPKRKEPEIILRNGRPAAVILDIENYREMLERLDDAEDLKALAEMRKRPLKFRRLEEFLREFSPRA